MSNASVEARKKWLHGSIAVTATALTGGVHTCEQKATVGADVTAQSGSLARRSVLINISACRPCCRRAGQGHAALDVSCSWKRDFARLAWGALELLAAAAGVGNVLYCWRCSQVLVLDSKITPFVLSWCSVQSDPGAHTPRVWDRHADLQCSCVLSSRVPAASYRCVARFDCMCFLDSQGLLDVRQQNCAAHPPETVHMPQPGGSASSQQRQSCPPHQVDAQQYAGLTADRLKTVQAQS